MDTSQIYSLFQLLRIPNKDINLIQLKINIIININLLRFTQPVLKITI